MVTILNDDELKEEMSKMRQKLGNRDKYETDAPSRRPQPPPPPHAPSRFPARTSPRIVCPPAPHPEELFYNNW